MEEVGRGKRRFSVVSQPPSPSPSEGSEDEDMNKFYALIRNIKAMRDAWCANAGKRPRTEGSTWKPRFTLDDFRGASGDVTSPARLPEPPRDEEVRKEEEEEEEEKKEKRTLDLNLAL